MQSISRPFSGVSVANCSRTVDVPDFTAGWWKTNQPVDVLLAKGGSTKVLL